MKNQTENIPKIDDADGSLIESLTRDSVQLYVKKLSTNDRDWARLPNKHQAGVYVPPTERDADFFPALQKKTRERAEAEILEAFFRTEWPQVGKAHSSRLVHYTSKGEETHLTRLPKDAFRDLSPASFLIIGKSRDSEPIYRCITIDSTSNEAEALDAMLDLGPDFRSGLRTPERVFGKAKDQAQAFLEEALAAFRTGKLGEFAQKHATIPATEVIAKLARDRYLKREKQEDLNPYRIARPGDAIRQISRGDEYELFKEMQLRAVSLELIRTIVGDDAKSATVEKVVGALISGYPRVDAILLSASQQRKSRAGYSFEHQLEQTLKDGAVPFEKQVVLDAKKRPDFVLPSLAVFKDAKREKDEAVILSAKTTLRERWKQVQREMTNCDLFLATVDENIAGNAIEDMRTLGIALVVPESLKDSDTTEYRDHPNVIDFKTFFTEEIADSRLPRWKARDKRARE